MIKSGGKLPHDIMINFRVWKILTVESMRGISFIYEDCLPRPLDKARHRKLCIWKNNHADVVFYYVNNILKFCLN